MPQSLDNGNGAYEEAVSWFETYRSQDPVTAERFRNLLNHRDAIFDGIDACVVWDEDTGNVRYGKIQPLTKQVYEKVEDAVDVRTQDMGSGMNALYAYGAIDRIDERTRAERPLSSKYRWDLSDANRQELELVRRVLDNEFADDTG